MDSATNTRLVTVIIPCYNGADFVAQAIESVLNQTHRTIELIVVDDGSTDASATVIKRYLGLDNRANYIHQENQGVSAARNTGIKEAHGEIIAFLDADDVWEPENLEVKVKALAEDASLMWVFSDMYLADEKLQITELIEGGNDEHILESLLSRTGEVIHAPSNLVVRASCLQDTGIRFDRALSTSADWDFCLQLASKGFRAKRIREPLWLYRVLENSMSRNIQSIENDNLLVQKKAVNAKLFRSLWFRQRCFSNNYLILAGCWWVNGNNRLRGAYFILKALLAYPPNLLKILRKLRSYSLYQAKRIPIKAPEGFRRKNFGFRNNRPEHPKNVTVFLFHRINTVSDPLWQPIHPHLFKETIAYLKKHFEPVPLKEFLLDQKSFSSHKPFCSIGFDDGYRDYLDYALPVLRQYECPSSMYVVTDSIDHDLPPWTYVLNHLFINSPRLSIDLDTTDFPGHLRNTRWKNRNERISYARRLNPFLKSLSDSRRRKIYESIQEQFSDTPLPHGLMLTWEEIRNLKDHQCEVGSHTLSHPVLSKKLDHAQLLTELKESALRIEKNTGIFPASISYPFGACNEAVVKASMEAGYRIGLTVSPTPYNSARNHLLEVPRIELFDEPFIKTRLRINQIMPKIKQIISPMR